MQMQHEEARGCTPSSGRKVRKHLQARHNDKKNVRSALKLLEQGLGKEGEESVLGGYHHIRRILQLKVFLGLIKIRKSGRCLRCRGVHVRAGGNLDSGFSRMSMVRVGF